MEIQLKARTIANIVVLAILTVALVLFMRYQASPASPGEAADTLHDVPASEVQPSTPALTMRKIADFVPLFISETYIGTTDGLYDKALAPVDVGISPLNVWAVLDKPFCVSYTQMVVSIDDEGGMTFDVPQGATQGVICNGEHFLNETAWDLALWNGKIYAATNTGVYEGDQMVGPPAQGAYGQLTFALWPTDTGLLVAAGTGIWRYDGDTWQQTFKNGQVKALDFAGDGTTVYAAVNGVGVLRSDDGGLTWQVQMREKDIQQVEVVGDDKLVIPITHEDVIVSGRRIPVTGRVTVARGQYLGTTSGLYELDLYELEGK